MTLEQMRFILFQFTEGESDQKAIIDFQSELQRFDFQRFGALFSTVSTAALPALGFKSSGFFAEKILTIDEGTRGSFELF